MMELKPSLLPVMPSSTVLEQALHPALHRLAPPPSKRSVDELMATSPAFVEQSEPTPVPDNSLTLEQRAVGCMLAAMCGNALGAPVANDRHWQVMRMFPRGLTEFWGMDFSAIKPVKRGHFTGDYQMLVATARSLARAQGRLPSVEEQAVELAVSCDPAGRRYSPYAEVLLDGLRGGQPIVRGLPHLAQSFLAQSQAQLASTATDRQERQPWGPADNGAAARIAPVALACAARGASLAELEAAVNAMCEVTHPHPLGRDGAWVVAAALHWLLAHHPGCRVAASQQLRQPVLSRSRQGTRQHHANGNVNSLGNADVLLPKPAASEQPDHSTPEALLEFLESVARTEDMRGKLQLLRSNLLQVSPVTSWPTFYASRDWQRLVQVVSRLTYHDYATSGTEAAAVALWALVTHWQLPRQAICVAATWGGSAPVTTQIVGVLAGAAHGSMWIPDSWMQGVENAPDPSSLSTRDSLTQPFGQAEGLQGLGLGVASQGVTAQDASQEASQGQQEVEQGMRPGTMAEGSEAFPLPGATALQGIRDEVIQLARQLVAKGQGSSQ
ncbi:ADP-ribosylation/Crystallin J1 [Haematococcus lacustris]